MSMYTTELICLAEAEGCNFIDLICSNCITDVFYILKVILFSYIERIQYYAQQLLFYRYLTLSNSLHVKLVNSHPCILCCSGDNDSGSAHLPRRLPVTCRPPLLSQHRHVPHGNLRARLGLRPRHHRNGARHVPAVFVAIYGLPVECRKATTHLRRRQKSANRRRQTNGQTTGRTYARMTERQILVGDEGLIHLTLWPNHIG